MAVQPIEAVVEGDAAPRTCVQCLDVWTWAVEYKDGSTLFECDGSGRHSAWKDIDVPAVARMVLLPLQPGFHQIVVFTAADNMRPIFFRRRYKELSIGSGEQVAQQNIHCLGYEQDVPAGEDGKVTVTPTFVFAFEDGSVLLTNDRNAV